MLYNNILINHHSFRGSITIDQSSKDGFVSDYNILENRLSDDDGNSNMGLAEWQAFGYDLHSFIADPEEDIFVNYTIGDFHLISGSQAIDAGTSLGSPILTKDIDNIQRPAGNGFDIGAYEFGSTTGVSEKNITDYFKLLQNYPNPFNPTTKIKFTIPFVETHRDASLQVTLKVCDVLGREVATLVNEEKQPGVYEAEFDGSNLSCGIYFYTLTADNFNQTKKLILLK